jgi:V8-like Glu-specific endopeptidase
LGNRLASASRWTGPGAAAVLTGLIGIVTLVISSCHNREQEQKRSDTQLAQEQKRTEGQLELENLKQRGTFFLEAIKTGNLGDSQAAANLVFLVDIGLLKLEDNAVARLRQKSIGMTPQLPAREPATTDPLPSGPDERVRVRDTRQVPYSAICRVVTTATNGNRYLSSGVLIAPRVVLTVGHAVYLHRDGGWASQVEVSPAFADGKAPFGTQVSTEFRAVTGWVNGDPASAATRESDYAVIFLPDDVKGVIPAKVEPAADRDLSNGAAVSVVGYPMDRTGGEAQWAAPGRVVGLTSTSIRYQAFTYAGMAGGPVLLGEGDRARVVGIHAYGHQDSKSAVRFTPELMKDLTAWIAESQNPPKKEPPKKEPPKKEPPKKE